MSELGRWCFVNRRRVLLAWSLALIAIFACTQRLGGEFENDFEVSGSESQRALERLQTSFPEFSGDPLSFVIRAEATIDDPAVRASAEAALAEVASLEGVLDVVSPYNGFAAVSSDRTTAIAQVRMGAFGPEVDPDVVRAIIAVSTELGESPGVDSAVGGPTALFAEMERPGSREAVGVVFALFVLVLTFGSFVAAGLPVAVALAGLGAGMALVTLLARVVEVSTFAPGMAAMIGLGVGIDYALFIVTRHRQGMADGLEPEDAAAVAVGTAGRAVVFAGATVVISMLGMLLIGVSMVVGMALAAVLTVTCTVIAAITLLPAVLGFVGRNLDRLPLGARSTQARGSTDTKLYRWSRAVQKRPWPAFAVSLVALVGLSLPVLGMQLGGPHFGGGPESHSSRRAYDLVTDAFGEGFNGPLLLVAEVSSDPEQYQGVMDRLTRAVAETEGVEFATPSIRNQAGDVDIMIVVPSTAPHSVATQELVDRLRGNVIPEAVASSGVVVSVSGVTALFADMADLLNRRLPLFIGAVLSLSFLLLMVVFRSVLVATKAAAMNLLSIGAAYGVVVAVFQWGWGSELLGVDRPGPIMAFVPVMLFAILFGLSMDYEVFLLSRVREEYDRTGDNASAVADGLAATGRVITAAATIMILIFLSFVLGDDPIIKTFGAGLAVAVFVDATIVRLVLVPATMELLGDANWWFPSWLDRWVPHLAIEESGAGGARSTPSGDGHVAVGPTAVVTEDVARWLGTLAPMDRGRAARHLERIMSSAGEQPEEGLIPLGRRRRSIVVTATDAIVQADLVQRRGGPAVEWIELRSRLVGDDGADVGYGMVDRVARVGDCIQRRREELGLTRDAVALRAGLAAEDVATVEAGGDASLASVTALCAVMDLDLTLAPIAAASVH